jgi:hypothetical protein
LCNEHQPVRIALLFNPVIFTAFQLMGAGRGVPRVI